MPDVGETVSGVLEGLPGGLDLWKAAYTALIVVAAVVVGRLVMALVDRRLKRSKVDPSLARILRGLVKLVVGVVCVLLICETLGVEITSLLALFSVVGLALSLAIQGVLANLAGGMVLLWAKPFRTGDFVEVDGVLGTVKETTLMYTKLNTTDNRLVSIPNKIVSEVKVVNFAAEEKRRLELTFSASYDSPIDQVKAAVLEAMAENELILPDPAPVAGVVRFGPSAIEYNLWAWCRGTRYWDALYSANEAIKRALDAHGLEMTYDHLNVHMIGPKPDTERKV